MVLQALEACRTGRRSACCGATSPGRSPVGCGWTTRGSIPGCWCTGGRACGPRRGRGGSWRRSARWWTRPGCSRVGVGGCWTPPSWRRGRHPGHGHPAGRGDPPGPPAVPGAHEVELATHDDDQPGKPQCAWDDLEAHQALVLGLVTDALRCLRRSPRSTQTMSRPRQRRCWRWSPAKTWSRTSGRARGGSLPRSPRIGSSPPSIPGAPCPQDQRAPARRRQGSPRRRTRDRAGHRVRT
jgi:hypothetical protein